MHCYFPTTVDLFSCPSDKTGKGFACGSGNTFSCLFAFKKRLCLILLATLLPFVSMAQTEGGAISRSQCVLTGQTPANLVSLRGAVDLGVGFYWESADNPAFTGPSLVSPFSPNAQTFAMGAHTVTTYYRRVVPTGLGSPFAYYSNTVKITIVGVTNAPSFIPTGVSPICQGNTSFTVSFLLSNSPTKYSIIWSTVPSGLGFADVLEQNLPGSSPLTVIVPASAPLGTYAGTLIPLDANGCSTSSAPASFTFNALPSVNSIAGSNAVCIGSTIPLTNTTIGGVWSSGTIANATISNTGVLTGVSAGTTVVSYTVTNVNGCVNAATSLKTINPL
ncbi:MAG: hypothetical protein ABIS69_03035, partial [Sediminibacterium sp.]